MKFGGGRCGGGRRRRGFCGGGGGCDGGGGCGGGCGEGLGYKTPRHKKVAKTAKKIAYLYLSLLTSFFILL